MSKCIRFVFILRRQLLRELVPSDLVKIQSTSDWKRTIATIYGQDNGMSPEDAKITFLKIIYRYVVTFETLKSMYVKQRKKSHQSIVYRYFSDGQHSDQHSLK